ncbi:hypothetical protein TNIN_429081 [Trichonephila inaurata madagascariensis]|uniref:Uncharacterized protein n=1 Tax=Trichonephila inaurata madagascariensis TaxID=2747483 RepID=A0A8X7CLR8_9ARAC|nr:hypothetical protein TNIN_429081 [Trichonephila inaurata madagascariensis]
MLSGVHFGQVSTSSSNAYELRSYTSGACETFACKIVNFLSSEFAICNRSQLDKSGVDDLVDDTEEIEFVSSMSVWLAEFRSIIVSPKF